METNDSASQGSVIPAEVPQYYLPLRGTTPAAAQLAYQAGVLAAATVGFVSKASGVSTSNRVRRIAPAPESALAIDWEKATPLEPTLEELDRRPYAGGALLPVPAAMQRVSSYRSWGGEFSDWAFRTQTLEVLRSSNYGLVSNPGEAEADFRDRVQAAAESKKQEATDRLRKGFEAKKATLEKAVVRAEQARDREAEQSRGRRMQTVISFLATVLRSFTGSKRLSTGTLDRATTTMRDVGRSVDQAGDVKRAEENLTAAKQRVADLEAQLETELADLEAKMDPQSETLETLLVRPRKSDITVDALGLVWMPHWKDESGTLTPAWE